MFVRALGEFNQLQGMCKLLPVISDPDQWIVFGSELVLKVAKAYKLSIPLFMQLSSGLGNLVVNPSTKCSFGFFCMIN
jgi:hypothetical protein